jgi:hypothetical protein
MAAETFPFIGGTFARRQVPVKRIQAGKAESQRLKAKTGGGSRRKRLKSAKRGVFGENGLFAGVLAAFGVVS